MYKADIRGQKSSYQKSYGHTGHKRALSKGIGQKYGAELSFKDMQIHYHSDAPMHMKRDICMQEDRSRSGNVIQRSEMPPGNIMDLLRAGQGDPDAGEGAGGPEGSTGYPALYDQRLDDNTDVVRGGLSSARTLIENQNKDRNKYMSANSANGVSLGELATTPSPFPNSKLTVSTVGRIRAIHMNVIPEPTRNNPYHAAIVPPRQGTPLTPAEADELSGVFNIIQNEWTYGKKPT